MLINNIAKLSHPARNATSAALVIIAALAMYKWTVSPQSGYLSAAKGYESAMDSVIKYDKIINIQVETKKKELQKLRESSNQLQSVLFNDAEAKEFFSDLQIIAEQSGCAVQSTNYTSGKANLENEQLGIETRSAIISVVGFYKDIEMFVGRLQMRNQKVWIDSIKMRTLDQSTDNVVCDLTITICQLMDKDIP